MTPKRILCTLEGYTKCWIERKNLISIRMWDEWKNCEDADKNRDLVLQMITGWNFPSAEDPSVPARQPSEGMIALQDLEIKLLPWLIRALGDSLIAEFRLDPLASTPSPT